MKCNSYNLFFETISNKLRLRIIELLMEKPLTVTEISKRLDEEQSKISHNLRKLSDCNFLTVRKEGKKRIYSLNKTTIVPLIKLVEKHVRCYCGSICRRLK